MTLRITGTNPKSFHEHGWGVVGERLGDASTETLGDVLPLKDKEVARELAGSYDASRLDGKSWLITPVSLVEIKPCEDGFQQAIYVEASNLTHPGSRH